ncbi:MAG TPA: hypothetical protein VHL79_15090 [Ramlibacter sp.]|jgi:hypothetical protein|nr:hypothetical protein [Ramlibacter sp.]
MNGRSRFVRTCIVMEEFMVPPGDPGIQLYVRNKHEVGRAQYAGDKVLLYVHGATYPAETAFDRGSATPPRSPTPAGRSARTAPSPWLRPGSAG